VLVALGVEALGDATLARRRRLAVVAGALAFALLVVTGAGRAHFAALAVAAAGALLVERGALAWLGGTLVVTALALDAALVVAPSVRTAPEAEIGRPAPGLVLPTDLAAATRIAELQRGVVDPGIPELTVRRRALETLAGFNPLIPWRFVLYASYAGGFDPFTDGFDVAVPLLARRAPALFDLLGVSHVLHPPSQARTAWRWERSATAFPRAYLVPGPIVVPEGRGETLVPRELDALARLTEIDPRTHVLLHGTAAETALATAGTGSNTTFAAFRPLTFARRSANHITLDVRLDEPGILVFNEPFFPGWRARADGHEIPVLRANVLFRALVLAAGGHHVELEFAPLAWRIGWWISLASTAALGVLGLIAWRAAPGARQNAID
jgi:hypothetical protein